MPKKAVKEVEVVKAKIMQMKAIAEGREVTIAEKQIQFSKMLTDLNQSFQKIKSKDLMVLIGDISKNLDVISTMTPPLGNDPLAVAQRSALERIKSTVAEIKTAINRQVEDLRVYGNIELPELKNVNVTMAVAYNAVSILPQIGIALALDFLPGLFLILIYITVEARKRYQDQEDRSVMEDEQRRIKGIAIAEKKKKTVEDKFAKTMKDAKAGINKISKEVVKKTRVRRKSTKAVDPKGKLVTAEAEDATTELASKSVPTNGNGK